MKMRRRRTEVKENGLEDKINKTEEPPRKALNYDSVPV
jgi:hypothetical protein